jgi:uncharacterized protein YndB with AHSA1/START domain
MTTDRIEKKIVLKAPQSRVWRAIADSKEFGAWFQIKFDGPFVPGASVKGQITHPGYEDWGGDFDVEKVEPERLFSFRWHPYAKPGTDYSGEPKTLVEFILEPVEGGTHLTITESGFDQIPQARREEAFRMNEGGWTGQLKNIERHVTA